MLLPFKSLESIDLQELTPGYLARALHGDAITMAIVEIEPQAPLPEHSHENEQLGLLIRGSVVFRIGDEEQVLQPGHAWRIPPNTPHKVTAGDSGAVVLDVFSPAREDWVALERVAARPPRWPESET